MDCQAGASSAANELTKNTNASNVCGPAKPIDSSVANSVATAATPISRARMKRRFSMISASAPAGIAKRNIGRLVAT